MTIAVDSIFRGVHKTGALEPCDVVKAELFSRFSGTEPRSSNSIPDSLHRDATRTWPLLLSQHSLQTEQSTKRRLARVTAMYRSSCWVVQIWAGQKQSSLLESNNGER